MRISLDKNYLGNNDKYDKYICYSITSSPPDKIYEKVSYISKLYLPLLSRKRSQSLDPRYNFF